MGHILTVAFKADRQTHKESQYLTRTVLHIFFRTLNPVTLVFQHTGEKSSNLIRYSSIRQGDRQGKKMNLLLL
jgi:hypothetical protein